MLFELDLLLRGSFELVGGDNGRRERRLGWSDSEDGDHDFWDFSRSNFVEFSDSATECLRLSRTNGGGGEGDKDELRLLKFGFLKGLGDLYLEPPGLL